MKIFDINESQYYDQLFTKNSNFKFTEKSIKLLFNI